MTRDYDGDELCPHGFYSEACGDCRDNLRDLSQRSTGVDALPADRAVDDPAQQVPAPTDLTAPGPDNAAGAVGTTGPAS